MTYYPYGRTAKLRPQPEQRQALDGVLHRGPVQQIAEGLKGIVDEGHGHGTKMFLETTGTSADQKPWRKKGKSTENCVGLSVNYDFTNKSWG